VAEAGDEIEPSETSRQVGAELEERSLTRPPWEYTWEEEPAATGGAHRPYSSDLPMRLR